MNNNNVTKAKPTKKNKNALEFSLVNREIDDPNYDDPNATDKILLEIPKDNIDEKIKLQHQKILEKIPEIARGKFTDEHITNDYKKFSTNDPKDFEKDMENEEIELDTKVKKVNFDMGKNKVLTETKKQIESINYANLTKEQLIALDDKKINEIFSKLNLPKTVKIVEYNELTLPKSTDKEVFQFATNKEFKEGVDIFMPVRDDIIIPDQFDIDIKPENMDQDYKEIDEALGITEKGNKKENEMEGEYEELEDDFLILANEGEVPIDLKRDLKEERKANVEDKKKTGSTGPSGPKPKGEPSYKYITKEECEYLDKRFNKVYEDYKKKDEEAEKVKDPAIKYISKEKFDEAIEELVPSTNKNKTVIADEKEDEEEYEEYDDDYEEEEEFEEFEEPEEVKEFMVSGQGKNLMNMEQEITDNSKPKKGKKSKRDRDNDSKNDKEDDDEEKKNPKNKSKKPLFKPKKVVDGGIDLVTFGNTGVEQTIALFEANFDEEAGNDDPEVYTKEYKTDITHVEHSIGNNPKTIFVDKDLKKKPKKPKNSENEKDVEEEKKEELYNKTSIENIAAKDETLEHKKLRKKLIKEEQKINRIEKKKLKEAYTKEKVKQMNVIAGTNKIIRSGVSVKEV